MDYSVDYLNVLKNVPTPSYIVDKQLLQKNLEILTYVKKQTQCKILLAQKGYSQFSLYPFIGEYLDGVTSSSLFEAKLGREYMNSEVHIYSPAYIPSEFEEIISIADHIVFNSTSQYKKYKQQILNSSKKIDVGIRVNPEFSELTVPIYDPCSPYSRLGVTEKNLDPSELVGIDGLHFHTMCEQNSDTLERTIKVIEKKFGKYLYNMKWINFGGGHHITRDDYDVEKLIKIINRISKKYDVMVYLEPGEAIALNCGYLVTSVLDVMNNGIDIAILDTSASTHMPDVIEMPYRPVIIGTKQALKNPYTYRLGGITCLAGDVIGDYSFIKPLKEGDKLIFTDMAHYTMVKNNTFNGVNLPSIYILDQGKLQLVKQFGYDDFKSRLS